MFDRISELLQAVITDCYHLSLITYIMVCWRLSGNGLDIHASTVSMRGCFLRKESLKHKPATLLSIALERKTLTDLKCDDHRAHMQLQGN